ncbi:MAG: LptF/LptG family permease [Flavobacteriales bacterium]
MLKAYIGPFLLTFFIALFFLMMQFLWKYIDDLMGKGLEWYTVLELLFYVSFNLVPMALPLAILLSSIMVMGNLGESNELTAMKSAGMSLLRIMTPLIGFVTMVTIGAFFFANYAWPWSNLKWKTLYWEIMEKKPSFSLVEKRFYQDIPQFTIRVSKKSEDGKKFEDVLIYDYSAQMLNRKRTIRAEEGEMNRSKDENFLILTLQRGTIYEDAPIGEIPEADFPFRKIHFKSAQFKFDLSGFKLSRGNEDLFKDSYEMLNLFQLHVVIDSLEKTYHSRQADYMNNLASRFLIFRQPIRTNVTDTSLKSPPSVTQIAFGTDDQLLSPSTSTPEQRALSMCENGITLLNNSNFELFARRDSLVRYNVEWHRKFTFPLACLVIFFIGAPLGAIVKRGGLGPALVLSVLLFLCYHILTISGEKMAKTQSATVEFGMWMATLILVPIGIFLTWQAARESAWIYHPKLKRFLRIFNFLKKLSRIKKA